MKKSILTVAAALSCFAAVAAQAAEPTDGLFGKPGVSDQAMSQLRGGTESSQTAVNVGDCDHCQVNGVSSISGNAFSGASGLITVIQNTGANMILQNSTVVNVSIH